MQEIKFGTDGFRGIIADNFTVENVKRIASAVAVYMKSQRSGKFKKGIVVGYDRRFFSKEFAESAAQEIAKFGMPVFLTEKPVPTPSVSNYIIKKKLSCGIIITASHNPPIFNGIKIKNEFGASAAQPVTDMIENTLKNAKYQKISAKHTAPVEKVEVVNSYINRLQKYLNLKIFKKCNFHVIIDVMHGVGGGIIGKILKNTECRITEIRNNRDVLFGGVNPEPIDENLGFLRKTLKSVRCDLALALDGDADRIGAMCPDGRYISSHQAICLLLLHFIENRKMTGRIVKSLNTTTMVDRIARYYNLPLDIVPVGFKYIAEKMLKEDVLIGGEESGGIGFKNYMPERDGVLSGLLLLELMASRKQSISCILKDMEKKFGRFVYMRKDLQVRAAKKIPTLERLLNKKVVDIKTFDGTKFILEDDSWLLIRASGTEPIVRIYAESNNIKTTQQLINIGCALL